MGYLFALFVNSGIIKSLFGDYLFFDITVVSLSIILFVLLFQILILKVRIRNVFDKLPIICIILFTVFILISTFYTPSPAYYKDKLLRVICLTIPSFLIPCLFFKLVDIKRFIIGSIIIYCVVIISLICFLSIYRTQVFYAEKVCGPHYLIWGSFIGYNSLLFSSLILDKNLKSGRMIISNEWSALLLSSAALYVIFIFGARGPFLFFLLSFLMSLFGGKHWRILVVIMIGFILVISSVLFFDNFPDKITSVGRSNRWMHLTIESSSIHERLVFYEESWNLIKEAPVFGYGIGSFSYLVSGEDKRGYPHNIFLEIWFENGILATFMFVAFLYFNFYAAIRRIDKLFVNNFLWVNVYFLFTLIKSSSLTDARVFFSFAGLLFASFFINYTRKTNSFDTGSFTHKRQRGVQAI